MFIKITSINCICISDEMNTASLHLYSGQSQSRFKSIILIITTRLLLLRVSSFHLEYPSIFSYLAIVISILPFPIAASNTLHHSVPYSSTLMAEPLPIHLLFLLIRSFQQLCVFTIFVVGNLLQYKTKLIGLPRSGPILANHSSILSVFPL